MIICMLTTRTQTNSEAVNDEVIGEGRNNSVQNSKLINRIETEMSGS